MGDQRFGPYVLRSPLGRGGMGEVWRAVDTAHGDRTVAVKLLDERLQRDPAYVRRFRREQAAVAGLTHPNIVPVHDYGEIDGRLYLVMQLVEGSDLGKLVGGSGPLPAGRAVALLAQVAWALDTAHAAGLVHRDVKPSNVLVVSEGQADHAYLIDFGLARSTADDTASLAVAGTMAYMAPERFDGDGDHRSDVYALGCVLYELLTGRLPFPVSGPLTMIKAHDTTPPPRPSTTAGVPAAFDEVVARAMAKDPRNRYPTCGALARAAQAVVGATGTRAQAPPPRRARPRWRRAVGTTAAVGAVVGGAVLLAVAVPLTRGAADDAGPGAEGPRVLAARMSLTSTAYGLALSPDGSRLLVANGIPNTVSVYRTDHTTASPVELEVGETPTGMVFSPDGRTAYVAESDAGTVAAIDMAALSVEPTRFRAGEMPGSLALTRDGSVLFAVDEGVEAGSEALLTIDTSRPRSSPERLPIEGACDLALTPDERLVVVADCGETTITVADVGNLTSYRRVIVGDGVRGVEVAGDRLFVLLAQPARASSGTTTSPAPSPGTLAVLDLEDLNAAPLMVPVGDDVSQLAVAADGSHVFVTHPAGTVTVLDGRDLTLPAVTVDVGGEPRYVVASATGGLAYVDTRETDIAVVATEP